MGDAVSKPSKLVPGDILDRLRTIAQRDGAHKEYETRPRSHASNGTDSLSGAENTGNTEHKGIQNQEKDGCSPEQKEESGISRKSGVRRADNRNVGPLTVSTTAPKSKDKQNARNDNVLGSPPTSKPRNSFTFRRPTAIKLPNVANSPSLGAISERTSQVLQGFVDFAARSPIRLTSMISGYAPDSPSSTGYLTPKVFDMRKLKQDMLLLLQKVDRTQSGIVSARAFEKILMKLGVHTRPSLNKQLISYLEIENDGRINYSNFLERMTGQFDGDNSSDEDHSDREGDDEPRLEVTEQRRVRFVQDVTPLGKDRRRTCQ